MNFVLIEVKYRLYKIKMDHNELPYNFDLQYQT